MMHKNKDDFIRTINHVASQTGFLLPLVEKDYYLTLILSRLDELCPSLVFKGGTCLNKIYFLYYRLSEDLDFTMQIPGNDITRSLRRKSIRVIKDNIKAFADNMNMRVEGIENAGRNESKQYVYYFIYQSMILPIETKIKFEIGLRFNPLCPPGKKKVKHKFVHPFTGDLLFDGGEVNCLTLKELLAEKLRAGATRKIIAPRDFYDIDFAIRNNFSFQDKEFHDLFMKKLEEDGADTEMSKYQVNLGRTDEEIKNMKLRIKEELFEVLAFEERKNFDIDVALSRINKVMHQIRFYE